MSVATKPTTRVIGGQDQADSDSLDNGDNRLVDLRFALAGGAIAAVTLFAGVAVVGRVSPYEGLALLQSVQPSVRFFASSVMAASATVMALMLTLLGFTYNTEWNFRATHFRRIRQISLLASASISLSVVTLMFMGLPVDEADGLRLYHHIVYYGLTAAAALLGGLMMSIVMMLQRTITGLVYIGHPSAQSDLIDSEDGASEPLESS